MIGKLSAQFNRSGYRHTSLATSVENGELGESLVEIKAYSGLSHSLPNLYIGKWVSSIGKHAPLAPYIILWTSKVPE